MVSAISTAHPKHQQKTLLQTSLYRKYINFLKRHETHTVLDILCPRHQRIFVQGWFLTSSIIRIKTFLSLSLILTMKVYHKTFHTVLPVSHTLMQSIASRRLSVCLSCAVMKPWLFKSRLYSVALLCFPSPMPRAWRSPRLGPLLSSSRKISLSRSPQPATMAKVHDVHVYVQLWRRIVGFLFFDVCFMQRVCILSCFHQLNSEDNRSHKHDSRRFYPG